MADIELVIKIPEEAYKLLQNEEIDQLGAKRILNAVANGMPLPKGHGDLIDRDAFVNKCNADRKHSCYLKSWTADDVLIALQNSYTNVVIKADKEGE